MELAETAWKGFRNLKPRRQKWRSGLNVLLGPNGSGKTNLLESLSFLCGWGAFPGNKASSVVAWDDTDKKALLLGRAEGERRFEVAVSIGLRVALKADEDRVTYSELRSVLPSLSFLPRDIDLIDGSPSVRRLFLDKLCVLSSPLYARRLAEYKQIVRHRTALLRRGSSTAPTRLPMIHLGGWLWERRRDTAFLLEEELARDEKLLPCRLDVALERRGSSGVPSGEEDMAQALEMTAERERHARSPLVGPHRDDLAFSCGERLASSCLSRGQKRRSVLALILAAARLVEKRTRLRPILLLDDIAAELDVQGRRVVGESLESVGWQVFVSGTEDPFPGTERSVWALSEGGIFSG